MTLKKGLSFTAVILIILVALVSVQLFFFSETPSEPQTVVYVDLKAQEMTRFNAIMVTILKHYTELPDTEVNCSIQCEYQKFYDLDDSVTELLATFQFLVDEYSNDAKILNQQQMFEKYGTLELMAQSPNPEMRWVDKFLSHVNQYSEHVTEHTDVIRHKISMQSYQATDCVEFMKGMKFFELEIYKEAYDKQNSEKLINNHLIDDVNNYCRSYGLLQEYMSTLFLQIMKVNKGVKNMHEALTSEYNRYPYIQFKRYQ